MRDITKAANNAVLSINLGRESLCLFVHTSLLELIYDKRSPLSLRRNHFLPGTARILIRCGIKTRPTEDIRGEEAAPASGASS